MTPVSVVTFICMMTFKIHKILIKKKLNFIGMSPLAGLTEHQEQSPVSSFHGLSCAPLDPASLSPRTISRVCRPCLPDWWDHWSRSLATERKTVFRFVSSESYLPWPRLYRQVQWRNGLSTWSVVILFFVWKDGSWFLYWPIGIADRKKKKTATDDEYR